MRCFGPFSRGQTKSILHLFLFNKTRVASQTGSGFWTCNRRLVRSSFFTVFSFLLDDIITTQLSANLFPSSLPATIHFLSVSRIVSSLREQVDDKATRCDETLLRIGRSGTERQAVKRVSSSTWCVIRTSGEKASQLKLDFRIYTRSWSIRKKLRRDKAPGK